MSSLRSPTDLARRSTGPLRKAKPSPKPPAKSQSSHRTTVAPSPTLPTSRAWRVNQAEAVIARLSAAHPDPRCELYFETPLQLLISVVLSAQMTDKGVNRCMRPLYEAGLDLDSILALGEAGFLTKIRTIGLAPTKSKRVLQLAALLKEKHGGEVPRTREELEALPGVGRKTANVILGELFGEPTLAVDTHVYRVTQRLGLQAATTAEKAELALLDIIDPCHLPRAHHLFILHGRYVCTALRPACESCLLNDLCPSRRREPDAKSGQKAAPSNAAPVKKLGHGAASQASLTAKSAAKAALPAKKKTKKK